MKTRWCVLPAVLAGVFLVACEEDEDVVQARHVRRVSYVDQPDFYYAAERPYSRDYGPLYVRDGRYYYIKSNRYFLYDRPTTVVRGRTVYRSYRGDPVTVHRVYSDEPIAERTVVEPDYDREVTVTRHRMEYDR